MSLVVRLCLSWHLEAPALEMNLAVMGKQTWGVGGALRGDGSRGVSAASGFLSLTLLEASLYLPVVGRKPCPHLPCSQVDPSPSLSGDGYSHPRAPWMFVDGAGEVRRVRASLALQVGAVIMLLLEGLLI